MLIMVLAAGRLLKGLCTAVCNDLAAIDDDNAITGGFCFAEIYG